ncbi:hypothetical protein [Flagellimonas sp. S3867]|uniref:hypothetical protein n=1 Tax=Flagellimonas sp. S3867 TaxID=2768063 RepID=UPI001682F123|nr:hypothetical protein [Flagellimonas sp. S3867]
MDFEHINIWYWALVVLVGLMGGIIGSYWGKAKNSSNEEIEKLQSENESLQAKLEACQKEQYAAVASSKTKIVSTSTADGFDAVAAKAAFGKKIKEDDLTLVEGIGPKIQGLFHNHGIKTWKALSETSTVKCQEVLTSAGKRYRIHDPASWPMQAKMAYKGQWEELAKWQIKHKSGKF